MRCMYLLFSRHAYHLWNIIGFRGFDQSCLPGFRQLWNKSYARVIGTQWIKKPWCYVLSLVNLDRHNALYRGLHTFPICNNKYGYCVARLVEPFTTAINHVCLRIVIIITIAMEKTTSPNKRGGGLHSLGCWKACVKHIIYKYAYTLAFGSLLPKKANLVQVGDFPFLSFSRTKQQH